MNRRVLFACAVPLLSWLSSPSRAGEPSDNDPNVIEAHAEAALKAKPKSVRSAITMVHLYNGHALAMERMVGGLPIPDVRNARKAELWRRRIIDACKDPETIGCGNQVTIWPDGAIMSFGLHDVEGLADEGFVHPSGIARTKKFFQPVTLRLFNAGKTLDETAGACAVRGLGYGAGETSPLAKKVTDSWARIARGYQATTGDEPNFFLECPIDRPFFKMRGKDGKPLELMIKNQKIMVDDSHYVASSAMWRLDPDKFFFVAAVPPAPTGAP